MSRSVRAGCTLGAWGVAAALHLLAAVASSTAQPACGPYWSTLGNQQGSLNGVRSFDDGAGAALFASGTFIDLPGLMGGQGGVARWQDGTWRALTDGMPSQTFISVISTSVVDRGHGPELHCLGKARPDPPPGPSFWFARVWEGDHWAPTPPGFEEALPIANLKEPAGLALYGGMAEIISGNGSIVRWAGRWEPVGSFNGPISPWAVFDDGNGQALYIAGKFESVAGSPVRDIARWDGAQWSGVGGGVTLRQHRAMAVYDDGAGPALYLADITEAGGLPINRLGKWDGTQWSNVGAGFSSGPKELLEIYSMEVFDEGSGPALYVAGLFSNAGGVAVRNLARWNGHTWSAVPVGIGWPVRDMAVFNDGVAESLVFAGSFHTAGGGGASPAGSGGPLGLVQYVGCKTGNCYADCDRDGALTLADFGCFRTKYALQDPYANCNLDLNPGSLTNGLSVADFSCFMTRFAQGCP